MNIVEYDRSGKILSVISYPGADQTVMELYSGRLFLAHEVVIDQSRDYIDDCALVARPPSPVSLNGQSLKGVPVDALIWVDDQCYLADGTDVEIGISQKGVYQIKVQAWPFLDFEMVYEN